MSERIFRMVEKIMSRTVVDPMTGCWLWTGPTSGNGRGGGYARMSWEGVTCAPHKLLWQIEHGPIVGRKQLDHCCRNRLCVNPDHLELVTQKVNCRRRDEARLWYVETPLEELEYND